MHFPTGRIDPATPRLEFLEFWIYLFKGHFVTDTSLYFWNLHKILRFLYPSWGGLKKIFIYPSYVQMLFFEARASERDQKKIFCRFCIFYIKMKLMQGDRTPKLNFH
jgi:hypothetical protein